MTGGEARARLLALLGGAVAARRITGEVQAGKRLARS